MICCSFLVPSSCLRSWLEQDTSCPTCRMSLNERTEVDPNGNVASGRGDAVIAQQPNNAGNQTTNHFFHFDGKIKILTVIMLIFNGGYS